MNPLNSHQTQEKKEQAFLVGIDLPSNNSLISMEDSLEELYLLATTAGLMVVGEATQKLSRPNPVTLIGSGKAEEVRLLLEDSEADVVIFDAELSPRHLRELEKLFGENINVVDRTALILDIFAQHAQTREGKLQVELAQYEYRLPRLTRAWTHLARQAGGGGGRSGGVGGVGLRGPGETQLEVDRREISRRISKLKSELEKVRAHRMRHRSQRTKSQIPVISLVGYTNAGKSTLLNTISSSDVLVADKLFATLDPTTRKVRLPGGNFALISDTVGFIQKLPTQLVAAFRATLEEISEANCLLHVLDCSHALVNEQWQSVQNTLEEINADHIPVITVLNKVDKIENKVELDTILAMFPDALPISALQKDGIDQLLSNIEIQLFESFEPVEVKLPYEEGKLTATFHQHGQIDFIEHGRKEVHIIGKLPLRYISLFSNFVIQQSRETEENET
ncbi:MAG: GTPase HflX [Anaerolineaceae bacterium]|nr:GTPase HflX [Anaerolineaceae bacterium]